ncbi:MAG TPA: glycerol kinase GlpK [Alphaproteobacteria bacterium]|nr:glycerol kinase GlpK [Alphaproteobacteria bacterium]
MGESGRFILAIDQGTTSTRAMLFDREGRPQGMAQKELPQLYPAPGWVEHDPEEIWSATIEVCRRILADAALTAKDVAAIGITNQRETTILWERRTGRPIHNAIVWQDRRTAEDCRRLAADGLETLIASRTGLLLDPYFSGSKIAWLLDHVPGARAAAERGELAFGTVDSFLLWRLTGGRVHATDVTNAARTLLFDIHAQAWDAELLNALRIPSAILPEVKGNVAAFGESEPSLLGASLPITGMAGDQQAATIGQACLAPGMIKATYGTGAFILLNTGGEAVRSRHKLITTIAYRLADGAPRYAVEGSIFVAGAAVQWLRDKLRFIRHAGESEGLAAGLPDNRGVYLVPAFTGLGAPHWLPEARGAIVGLTRDSGPAEIVRAALESVCYQTHDLMSAMTADGAARPTALRVDGGMVGNDWLLQFLADILALPVARPAVAETTALGAAYLAGLQCGFFTSPEAIDRQWRQDRLFEPRMTTETRARLLEGWQRAVTASRHGCATA